MKKIELIAWLCYGSVVVGWMLWGNMHLPHCAALYGVGAPHESTDSLLTCSSLNTASVFANQTVCVLELMVGAFFWLMMSLCGGRRKRK